MKQDLQKELIELSQQIIVDLFINKKPYHLITTSEIRESLPKLKEDKELFDKVFEKHGVESNFDEFYELLTQNYFKWL